MNNFELVHDQGAFLSGMFWRAHEQIRIRDLEYSYCMLLIEFSSTLSPTKQKKTRQNYKEKDAGKVVLYTTSMGIVRQTYAKCANVKQILRTLLVKFEERDVFMSIEYQQEVRDRMQSDDILIPQLYVDGHHVGVSSRVWYWVISGVEREMSSWGGRCCLLPFTYRCDAPVIAR